MLLNSSAIIVCALKPLILVPSPKGTAIAQLSFTLIVHLSTSRRGPLLSVHMLRKIGAPLHIVSIYSKITLLCLNAAPTITIFVPGINVHFKSPYTANKYDLPNPRLAMYMGKARFQSSCKITTCSGRSSTFNSFFTVH